MKPSVQKGALRIILGGGIGSGKSLVAELLDAAGAAVISADGVGHGVLEPGGPAFADVATRWPSVVVGGSIDRSRLADIVFDDPDELAALEALTHPAIIETILDRVAAIDRPVVVEVPLILGLGDGWCRVFVDAGEKLRIERAVARGGEEADIRRRVAVQPEREAWLGWADEVMVNEGTVEELSARVNALWDRLGDEHEVPNAKYPERRAP
ncbi:MAG: dephospho-CoA kinase [Acidimicrobiia bacterium]|nr:MAG: dephospho-CoA kinase [Acidimicrobiia bacterium]